MIEGIKNIIELFLDKSKHWTLRAGIFISIIGMLFIIDFTFDISYNSFISNKLENLEKIQIIKKGYEKDSLKLKNVNILEQQIINKKHYSELLFRDFNLSFNSLKNSITPNINDQNQIKITNTKHTISKPNIRSSFLMLISSNFFFLIVLVILLFSPFFDNDLKTLKSISSWFASLISFSIIIVLTTLLAFKIPIIYNEPIYNYALNLILHTLLVFILAKIFAKDGKITIY